MSRTIRLSKSLISLLCLFLGASTAYTIRPEEGSFSDFWARGLLDKEPRAVHFFVPRTGATSTDARDLLLSAYSYQSAGWERRALHGYEEVVFSPDAEPLADWAAFWIGELAQDLGEKTHIREIFSSRSPPWGRFWLAAQLFSEGDYDSSSTMFTGLAHDESAQTILRLMSGYFLGLSYTRLGEIDFATKTFDDLLDRYPRSLMSGEIEYRLASIAFSQERWEDCRKRLDEAMGFYEISSRKSSHWWVDEALFLIAAADFMEGRHLVAIRNFENLEHRFQDSPYIERLPYLSILGEIETKATDAARDSALLSALSPDLSADVVLRIGYLFMQDGELNTAQDKFLEAADIAEDKTLIGECFLFAGECAYNRRMFSDAVEYYEITYGGCPDRVREASWGLGWSYLRLRLYDDARLYLASVFAGNDDEFADRARLTYAETFLIEGRPRRAIAELNDFLPTAGEDIRGNILYDLIVAFRATADTARIVETSRSFMAGHRRSVLAEEVVPGFAEILFAKGNYSELIDLADEVDIYAVSREMADRVRILGERSRYHAGIYGDPLDITENFLRKYPDSPLVGEVLLDIGSYLCNIGDYEKGAITFDRLRRRKIPDSLWIDASYRMGLCYLGMGDTVAAGEILRQLLGEFYWSPLAAKGMIALGDYLGSIGEYESATEVYNKVLEYASDMEQTAVAELKLAESYEGLEKLPEARILYKNIYESEDVSVDVRRKALLGLVRVHYSMADYESGYEIAKEVFDTLPPDSFRCALGGQIGKLALRLGWADLALERLLPNGSDEFACVGIADQSVLYDLALSLEARNMLSDAKRVWEWMVQVSEDDSVIAMVRDKLRKYGTSSQTINNSIKTQEE